MKNALIATQTAPPAQAGWQDLDAAYATVAQGAKADSALQPAGNGSSLTSMTKAQVGLGNVDNTSDANKPVSTAEQTALNLKANLASPTFTGTVVLPAGQALVTPAIGAATGTSLVVTGAVTSSGGAVGYATGAGGAVTQLTSKSTASPAINKMCGTVTMNAAALAAGAIVTFTLSNNLVLAGDVIALNHSSAGTAGAYSLNAQAGAGSATINVRNNTGGSLSEAIVIRFAIIRAVAA